MILIACWGLESSEGLDTTVKGDSTIVSLTSLTLDLGTGFFYKSTFPTFGFKFGETNDILPVLDLF